MTTKVTITHSQDHYPSRVKVLVVNPADGTEREHAVLSHGESTDLYLHSSQHAKLVEESL